MLDVNEKDNNTLISINRLILLSNNNTKLNIKYHLIFKIKIINISLLY
jgi:hypothetical protein